MKFYYKRRGSEVIPNKSFWLQFPLLVQVPKINTDNSDSVIHDHSVIGFNTHL